MKKCILAFAVLCLAACGQSPSTSSGSSLKGRSFPGQQDSRFPRSPHPEVTPGSLCHSASYHRYPENVAYCNRDVEPELKAEIFVHYDKQFGYQTRSFPRGQFKIDHLIPLCLGGSNDEENLWPQHESIFRYTDPIEPYLCELLAAARLKQTEAVQIIQEVKQAPETTDARMAQLQSRLFGQKKDYRR